MLIFARIAAVVCGVVGAVAMALALTLMFMWVTDSSGHGEIAFLFIGAVMAGTLGALCLAVRLVLQRLVAASTV
jgi:hypothetical protein